MLLSRALKKLRDWCARRTILREVASQRWIERARMQQSAVAELNAAERALGRREWEAALRICERVQQKHPGMLRAYLLQARALRETSRSQDADTLIETIRPRFPDHFDLAVLWAGCAQQRGDPTAAIARWQQIRKEFPTEVRAFNLSALFLVDIGRMDEADTLLSEAMLRFPDQESSASRWAEVAVRRRDWPQALQRWQNAAKNFPGSLQVLLGIEKSLCELQRFDEAEALLEARQDEFRRESQPWVHHARHAQRRRDWPEAERRWTRVHGIFPSNIPTYLGLAVVLREQQRFDEAQALLEEAMTKAPSDAQPWIEHAALAHHRRDWAEAVRRWEAVRTRFPSQAAGFHRGAAALAALGRHAEAEELKSDASRRFASKPG
jgi:tetratricopeptide (TPR) repeat protein